MKLDSNFEKIWLRKFEAEWFHIVQANSVVTSPDNGFIIGGEIHIGNNDDLYLRLLVIYQISSPLVNV